MRYGECEEDPLLRLKRGRFLPTDFGIILTPGREFVVDGQATYNSGQRLFTPRVRTKRARARRSSTRAGANDVRTLFALTSRRIIQCFNYDIYPEDGSILQTARRASK